jgi:hypothetical protein
MLAKILVPAALAACQQELSIHAVSEETAELYNAIEFFKLLLYFKVADCKHKSFIINKL